MNSTGTALVSHTALAERTNLKPAAHMRPAPTRSTTGRPRRRPTDEAVAVSTDRCTYRRDPGISPADMIEAIDVTAVPWNRIGGGSLGSMPSSMGTVWPWLALIRPVPSQVKRCLSLRYATSSTRSRVSDTP